MTLLSIVQNVANEVGIAVPAFVMAATDPLGKQLLQLANRSGQALVRRHPYAMLQREQTVTLVDGQADYALPSDFGRFIDRTQWDRNNNWELIGPMSPQEWQWRKSGVVTTSPRRRFRIKPNISTRKLYFDPTPTSSEAGQIMVFEYVSTGWVLDNDGATRRSAWSEDTDISLIDEQAIELALIWRFLRAKGLSYDEEKDAYENYADAVYAQEIGMKALRLDTRAFDYYADNGLVPPVIPESGYGP